MKLAANTFRFFLLTILGIFVLSSCNTDIRTRNEPDLPSNVTLEKGTSVPYNESTPSGENEPTITATSTIIGIYEFTTAQEAAETYYELMSAQKYAEAYQLLSPLTPHLKTPEEFVSRAENLYESYKLISIESYPVWRATLYAGTPTLSMTVENERCKRFIVEVKVEYKEGQMGAGPSGTYPYALTVIKDEDGWKLVQIDTIPDPYVCEKY